MAAHLRPEDETQVLNHVNNRLAITPVRTLPHTIPHIVNLLHRCRTLISTDYTATSRHGTEVSVAVHKLKTKVSALLQDRSVEGRWSAVVLIKSLVELGGLTIVQNCKAWVQILIGILKRPDPVTTKKLCILTLTRIFILTRESTNLVREITTPSLPPFITACLTPLASSQSGQHGHINTSRQGLLSVVLWSFTQLLPRHATIFRTYLNQVKKLVVDTLFGSCASGVTFPLDSTAAAKKYARRLYSQFPYCASKSTTSSDDWADLLHNLIASAHDTADAALRAFAEAPRAGRPSQHNHTLPDSPFIKDVDQAGLPGWQGLEAGIEKLSQTLRLIESFVTTPLNFPIPLPIGPLANLLQRLLQKVPHRAMVRSSWATEGIYRSEISKSERDNLLVLLPDLHVAAMKLAETLLNRIGSAGLPLCEPIFELLAFTFAAETYSFELRAAAYNAAATVLEITVPLVNGRMSQELGALLSSCCRDLACDITQFSKSINTGKIHTQVEKVGTTKSTLPGAAPGSEASGSSELTNPLLHRAAERLLQVAIRSVPPATMPKTIRQAIDQTAVLGPNLAAMTASVLNPSVGQASLVPIFARLYPDDAMIEALARPRMPVIQFGKGELEDEADANGGVGNQNGLTEDTDAVLQQRLRSEYPTTPGKPDIFKDIESFISPTQTAAASLQSTAATVTVDASSNNVQSLQSDSWNDWTKPKAPPKRSVSPVRAEQEASSKRPRFQSSDDTSTALPGDLIAAEIQVASSVTLPIATEAPQQYAQLPEAESGFQRDEPADYVDEDEDDEDLDDFELPELELKTDSEDGANTFGDDDV